MWGFLLRTIHWWMKLYMLCSEFWASCLDSQLCWDSDVWLCMYVLIFYFYFGLPIAIGTVKMHHLVGESKWAHPCFRDASTALPGVADGKPYAAVFQPSAVTLVVVLETPGRVKLANQRQLSSLTFTCVFCLLEGERPRYVGDGACERRKDLWKTSRKLESSGFVII